MAEPNRAPEQRRVVAVVLSKDDEICLLRRSRFVSSDRGRWHCITGFVEEGVTPAQQARREVQEEAGLSLAEVRGWLAGETIGLRDAQGGVWWIWTFRCEVSTAELSLNWEHDAYSWVKTPESTPGSVVPWFSDVMEALSATIRSAESR